MARTTVSIDDDLLDQAKNANINVSEVTRNGLKDMLSSPDHHFFNTNEENLPAGQSGAGVYGHGVVATFADSNYQDHIEKFGGYIGEVNAGDRIYSWENNYGLRAIGIALEDGSADPVPEEHRLFHSAASDIHEFHTPVRWTAVLNRHNALEPDEVKQIVGHPVWGRGTYAELKDEHYPQLLWDVVAGRA